jgi:hypothetical protein
MQLNPAVFEKLLFPLHKSAYRQIQDIFDKIELEHPGKLAQMLTNYRNSSVTGTLQAEWRPGNEENVKYPEIDISIVFDPAESLKMSTLYKSAHYKLTYAYHENPASAYHGNHLVAGFYRNGVLNTFIVPIEYLLGFNEKMVLKEGSHQLYSHTLLPEEPSTAITHKATNFEAGIPSTHQKSDVQRFYQDNSFIYIGITKRTWQERYKQHWNDSVRGSGLLFHRALRNELFKAKTIEHIVERAGLTEDQALDLEEAEVEKRSLHSLYEKGLNMIPGGRAGMKYINLYAQRTKYKLTQPLTAETVESILVDVQKAGFKQACHSTDPDKINAEIARLWSEDLDFRIKATTNQHNRFSLKQIQAARIWHASGWPVDKILDYLQKLDNKQISLDQLEKLLKGETYSAIPDILI